MSALPSTRTQGPRARTTAGEEAASYPKMGDLLPHRRPPRILVVDDQPSIAGLMSQLLTIRGYEVYTAATAQHPEAQVGRQLPDLILSNVTMPGSTAHEPLHNLKSIP